jgi:hypothetical protein
MTKQEIKESIQKIGWLNTFSSLKTQEERQLYLELAQENIILAEAS